MDNIILGNRYQLQDLIGVGGMAKVYKATDRLLQRDVAIKILKDQYAEDDEFVKKFSNEALSAARLTHVNIVSVYDIGEDLIEGKKIHYIVMEYVDGETLKDLIDREKIISNHDIVDYSIQIAQALNQAHSSNIIHRDIKPQNILMDKYGLLKVTDFGIARVSTNATITYTSSILGTVHYISPEQAKGKFVDEKSDLYSLGVVMYEMATGKVPFDADNSVGIAVMHIQDEPESPIKLNENLSPRLNDIIMKLLEKDPQKRFKNANELIRALEDNSYDIGLIKKEDTAKIEKPKEITETTFIPVVENKKKKDKEEGKKEELENEAVYVTPTDKDEKNPKEKKKKRKLWPFILLLIAVLAGGLYYVKSSNSNMVQVPTVLNLSEEEAVKILEEKNLKANISRYAQSNNYEAGKVMEQDPTPKTKVRKNSTVNLVVSQGREVKVPDLSGLTLEQAEEKLKELDLELGKTSTDFSESVKKDKIIDQDPRKNEKVQAGSEIDVTVSLGKEEDDVKNVKVPNFVGNYEEDAISLANENGLTVGNITYKYSDKYEKGVVISQSIAAKTQVAEHSSIDFVVSRGKNPNDSSDEGTDDENKSQQVNVKFTISVPTDKDSFNVKVYKLGDNNKNSDLLYNQNHTKDELDSNGNLNLDFKSVVGTKVNILIDDKSQGVYEVNR
ncbi:Stk1 family PASTA domain-containing Ser/Thr kinase [Anaerococcus hydrogenalis]|uniref:non-specific serine/threonine protein kinase n=1 Tax=Anaerococcus hydrogenalis TaxID=33029 RepID=A0A2N6UKI8_9FIRM|nr:Stk1 family PASTA domain-containing Ser/Thr kinase [Anaerococcus hydrogenalis]MBS5989464.1 Stk1 family PASTA domain-containing Ser/Thr kinase [Anaerococcus hydrogenalis]MDK7694323.1 Stk1 family PASTA domain-containing Ser/Thr kinase [Anaerococcus hydrogenalis]MDK7696101.1 Stk1 family PASTA domain-containing Ser/Thr kinase [Anaerococcus hydrogenalis]MDK7707350.1 Stk1 family PASTA domain-containing Ser/Thr kinase [Anaerococcus hydrogenalis]PMC82373.1 serine/threonine protein kinase [Anaerococ